MAQEPAIQSFTVQSEAVLGQSSDPPTEPLFIAWNTEPVSRWRWLAISIVAVVLASTVIWVSWNSWYLRNRFAWNIEIAGTDVGGMTISEARSALEQKTYQYQRQAFIVKTDDGSFPIVHASVGPDFGIHDVLANAYAVGHSDDVKDNHLERFASNFKKRTFRLSASFDANHFLNILRTRIPLLATDSPKDAQVKLIGSDFVVTEGREGYGFDEGNAIASYSRMLEHFESDVLQLKIQREAPDIDLKMALRARRMASYLVHRRLMPIYSYDGYNYDRWTIELWSRRNWVEFKKVREAGNYFLYPVLKSDKLTRELNTRIAPYMYRAKEDVRIENVNGQPVAVGVAKDGYYLDVPRSIKKINRAIMTSELDTSGNYSVILEVAHLKGGVANPENEFGISEVLATGVTDFFGSPENRKFNINHASKNFHNVFLKPGEKFSFIQHMGKVDSTTGYAKELVIINGDSTEPQYGGGICQVSSTLFRTVFFAGLKVLKRTNHSFEVKYYLPAGLDATVFDPAPDLVFQNDTENLLLIQNLVDLNRTKMYFKIYGKNEGRHLSFDGPYMDGSVGEKEEHYQVTWYRDIEFPDGKTRRDKFISIYRNKDLVKKYQPENLLVQQDSIFVPVSIDSNSFQSSPLDSTKR